MSENKQMRFSEEELNLIKNTFKGNEKLLKLLRKVFLPEFDPQAPLGQVIDLWMTLDLGSLTPDEQIRRIHARNQVITHIEQQLIQLSLLAEVGDDGDVEERAKKNSSR